MSLRTSYGLFLLLGAMATSARAETLELVNGDKVSGEIVERTDELVVLEHPVLGRIELPTDQLKPEEPPAPARPGLFGTSFMEGWTRELSLGLNGSEGNTVNANLRAGLELDFESDTRRWVINGRYIYKTEDRSTTDNNGRLDTRHEWLLPGTSWFAFVTGTFNYDDFNTWKYRATVGAGPGYQILKRERFDLRSGLGLAVTREFAGDKETRFEGLWGVLAKWRVAPDHTLSATNMIFPGITKKGEYRNLSTINWKIKLLEDPGLNLNVGLENEYDSDAPPEDDKNDLKYYGNLGLTF